MANLFPEEEKEPVADRIAKMEVVVKRRRLFSQALTPEVIEELEKFFGVSDSVFSFRQGSDGKMDPYMAAQQDALFGVIRGLKFEIAHLQEAEDFLAALIEEQQKEQEATETVTA